EPIYGWTFEAHHEIAPGMLIFIADVHPSGVSEATVNPDDLAMVDEIQPLREQPEPCRKEHPHLDPVGGEAFLQLACIFTRTKSIQQEAHGHSALGTSNELVAHAFAGGIVLEDIDLQMHALAGGF